MTRTQHFFSIVLFITAFLLTAHILKRMQLVGPAGMTYEGFEMSGGAIAGIIFGVLAGIGLLYFLYKRFFGGAVNSYSAAPTNYSGNNRGNYRGSNNRGAAAY